MEQDTRFNRASTTQAPQLLHHQTCATRLLPSHPAPACIAEGALALLVAQPLHR